MSKRTMYYSGHLVVWAAGEKAELVGWKTSVPIEEGFAAELVLCPQKVTVGAVVNCNG